MPDARNVADQLFDFYDRGRQDLKNISDHIEEVMAPKRYSGDEMAKLVGVSHPQRIYALQTQGRLPPPDRDERGRRMGATIEQILEMQTILGTLAFREDGDDPIVFAVSNFKGGCWKSTTAFYFASWLAHRGYRVLIADLDPQATLTELAGHIPDQTDENDEPLPLFGDFIVGRDEVAGMSVGDLIEATHMPNMDLLPAGLGLSNVDLLLAREFFDLGAAREEGAAAQLQFEMLHRAKSLLGEVSEGYDFVVLDGTPSLGLLALNIIFASDVCLCPVPTEKVDFASTLKFCDLASYWVGGLGDRLGVMDAPEFLFVPTKYGSSTKTNDFVLKQIHHTFGEQCLSEPICHHKSVVSNLSLKNRTVFDINASEADITAKARNRAIENFEAVFVEVFEKAVVPRWTGRYGRGQKSA